MQLRDVALLAACGIFSGISPEELADSLARIQCSVRSFEGKSVVLLAGCRYSSLYVLLEGEASAEMTSDDGKVIRMESFKAVEALASAILFTKSQTLPVSVEARTACRFAIIPKEGLLSLCQRHMPILESLLGEIGGRVDALTEKLRAAQFADLREKLADWILRRRELSGSRTIRTEASRERMAELFGVARPSLSRELGALKRMGILEIAGKELIILDEAGLRRIRNSRGASSPARR